MITIECAWCEAELAMDGLDATSVDCPDCLVSIELAPDATPDIALAA
jgi:hypothetical protein